MADNEVEHKLAAAQGRIDGAASFIVSDDAVGYAPSTAQVVIADPSAQARQRWAILLGEHGRGHVAVRAEAADAEQAIRACEGMARGVVLIDVRLPGWVRLARAVAPTAVAIVLVADPVTDGATIMSGLIAGASGFIDRSADGQQVVTAVRDAGRHTLRAQAVAVADIVARVGPPQCPGLPDAMRRLLSARERDMLHLIGLGYSDAAVARALGLHQATTRAHVRRLHIKLEARNRAQLIIVAVQARPPRSASPRVAALSA